MVRTGLALVLLFFAIILIPSCKCSRKGNSDTATNSKVNEKEYQQIHIKRFEKDLFAINIDSIKSDVEKLKKNYPKFLNVYSYKVIQLGSPENPEYADLIKGFITDYFMNLDYNKVMETFPEISDIESDINKAFKNYQDYFPGKQVPAVYTCISGWNHSVFTDDSIIGIALDKYLGRKSEFYEKLGLDQYKRYTLQREYILPDVLRGWAYTEFELSDSSSNLLDNMLYEGKVIYFIKELVPEMEDSIAFGISEKQIKWCANNTTQMWTYLAEHKLLFTTDNFTIHKFIYPAPFTSYFTSESPGRAVVWLGYKIVESYMKHNSDITLAELMQNKNSQLILRASKFNP